MSVPRFTTRQLSAFIAAAQLGNFTLAAGRLNLTPSAVSNLISELEQGIGFTLFERTTRKIALTSDGRKFLPAALGAQRQFTIAAVAATDIASRTVDAVRVAAPPGDRRDVAAAIGRGLSRGGASYGSSDCRYWRRVDGRSPTERQSRSRAWTRPSGQQRSRRYPALCFSLGDVVLARTSARDARRDHLGRTGRCRLLHRRT